jgi:hypothetical protein
MPIRAITMPIGAITMPIYAITMPIYAITMDRSGRSRWAVFRTEVLQEGLSHLRRIGEVVSEVVERRPASLVVARIVRPKFARQDGAAETVEEQLSEEAPEVSAVVIAPPPERLIERGLASPGLLARLTARRGSDLRAQPAGGPAPLPRRRAPAA